MTFVQENGSPAVLVQHYEKCFQRHGPTAQGVDWPNAADALLRHKIMAELWESKSVNPLSIVDVGCGYGAFLGYLLANSKQAARGYSGIDLSEPMLEWARKAYPSHTFTCQDILKTPFNDNQFEYGVMNGVLTEKLSLSFEHMEAFAHQIIKALFQTCKRGIAFNVMSSHVDWQRDDLFHLPLDRLADFLTKNCSRHWQIRQDYGLYEYTVYLYHQP